MNSRHKLFFNHIPKTAGTTVSNYLTRFYSIDETIRGWQFFCHLKHYVDSAKSNPPTLVESIIPELTEKIERALGGEKPKSLNDVAYDRLFKDFYLIVYGHKNYQSVLPSDWKTITFLREPLSRLVSQHIEEGHILEERLQRRTYLSKEVKQELLDRNDSLAGKLRACDVDQTNEDLYWNVMTTNLVKNLLVSNSADPRKLPPEKIVEIAKRRLDNMFLIGITERFSESMALLQYKMGGPYEPHIRSANVRHSSDAVESFTTEDRELIDRSIAMDREVYAYGVGLFEAQLQQMLDEGRMEYGIDFSDRLGDLVNLKYLKTCRNRYRGQANLEPPISWNIDMRDCILGTGWHERMSFQDHIYRWTGPSSISTIDVFLREAKRYRVSLYLIDALFSGCHGGDVDQYWDRSGARLNGKSGRLHSEGISGDFHVARADFDGVAVEEGGFVRLELEPPLSSLGESRERGKKDRYQRGLPVCRIELEGVL